MKNTITLLCTTLLVFSLQAQMHVKKFNTTTFNRDQKTASTLLDKNSSAQAKQHPEYGVRPVNAQCVECVELIDKRTIDSRLFIDPKKEGHTYSQQSFFPLHYKKTPNDMWRTIDARLRPQSQGVYTADNQPVPTKCDLNKKLTSLNERGFEFEFNKDLSLHFFDDNTLYTQKQNGDYSNYTIGEEGLNVKNIWPGIEMEQLFSAGQVKTNFVIAAPLQLPISHGWMVIEDHFTLPANISIVEEPNGSHTAEGYFRGDYLLKNEKGETLITYEKPVYIDTKVFGMHGVYNLLRDGNNYTLQMLIPIEWLNKPDNTYPLTIDPIVYGVTKNGDFTSTGFPSGSMGFTSMALGSCDYNMTVLVPGKSQITNSYVDVEYTLTYDNTCGTPPLPPPFCTFSQVSMEVKNNQCNTTSGLLSCNPANPPYTGTCTTDSNLVPGASALNITGFVPNYLGCIAPQCAMYEVTFTLKNRDSICGDMCGYLCARGNMWRMTVEGVAVGGFVTSDKQEICAGDSVRLTAHAEDGFAPYTYEWFFKDLIAKDTIITDSTVLLTHASGGFEAWAVIHDSCSGSFWQTDTISVVVHRATITISGDTLIASEGLKYQWRFNGNALPGDTFRTLIATQPGQYTVEINDGFCTTISSTLFYLINAIEPIIANSKLQIIPNPSNGNFQLRFSGVNNTSELSLRIHDVSGKLIEQRNNISITGSTYTFSPGAKMAAGVYFIQVDAGGQVYREKILITQ
ncbi:MAG TPA: T9SS type A sorting domain-containing protein [Chitinophagales bacterium]|nr:T9SS type A sorting domain-containing protein [Chitinophagales bacterium]